MRFALLGGGGGGGANKQLSNLTAPTQINVDLLPDFNNAHDIGSAVLAWKVIFGIDVKTNQIGTISGTGAVDFLNKIDMNNNIIEFLAEPTVSHNAATKNYVDTTAANRYLSNLLAPTSLNQNLLPNPSISVSLGAFSNRFVSGYFSGLDVASNLEFASNKGVLNTATLPDGTVSVPSMRVNIGEKVAIFTPNTTGVVVSEPVFLQTGNTVDGNSGDIVFRTGVPTGTGTRGKVSILASSLDMNGSDIIDTGSIYPITDNSGNIGVNTLRFASVWADFVSASSSFGLRDPVTNNPVFTLVNLINQYGVYSGPFMSAPLDYTPGSRDSFGFRGRNFNGTSTHSLVMFTGNANTAGDSGLVLLRSGNAPAGNSGKVTILTGTAGVDSGDIEIISGAATGLAGELAISAKSRIKGITNTNLPVLTKSSTGTNTVLLDIQGDSQGIRIPVQTVALRNAMSPLAYTKIVVDNSTTGEKTHEMYDGSGWKRVDGTIKNDYGITNSLVAAVTPPCIDSINHRQIHFVEGDAGPVQIGDFPTTCYHCTEVMFIGKSDANTVTIEPSPTMVLNGTATLGEGDSITFVFDKSQLKWYEIARNA